MLFRSNAPGVYDVSLTVTDANGTNTRTITGFITYMNSNAATPVSENAENQAVAPNGWMLENPDASDTWSNVSVTGADGNATRAWRMDYYYYNAPGQVDRLVSPVITAHPTETRRRTVFDTQHRITQLMRLRLHGQDETEDGRPVETELPHVVQRECDGALDGGRR